MRSLKREERGFWVAKYEGRKEILDDGNHTGEYVVSYGKPEMFIGTISPRSGNTWGDGFGIGVDCDRTVIIDEIGTGIDETCIVWVDSKPETDEDGNLLLDEKGNPTVLNDYTITMAGESFNLTHLAIKKAY